MGDFLNRFPNEAKPNYTELQERYNRGLIRRPATGPSDNDAYGGMDECPAVARLYNRPVVVLARTHPTEETLHLNRRPIVYEPDGSQRDIVFGEEIPGNVIVLVHSGGQHWDGIQGPRFPCIFMERKCS
jgi:hypothetical protein